MKEFLATIQASAHRLSRLLAMFGLFTGLLISSAVMADRFDLESNVWHQLVLPADPDGNTIGDLFLDDFAHLDPASPTGDYGNKWVVWLYDASTRSYVGGGLNAVLETGQAFWIAHVFDRTVTIDVPSDLPAATAGFASNCISSEGCYTIDLPDLSAPSSGSLGQRIAMIGSPFPYDTVVADIRLLTNVTGEGCNDGCDLVDAENQGYAMDTLIAYDHTIGDYRLVKTDGTPGVDLVSAWQGYWMIIFPDAADNVAQWRLPLISQKSTLRGRVTTPDGAVVPNAEVTIESIGLGQTVDTDGSGRFSLEVVADAPYHVSVASPDHASQVKFVTSAETGSSIDTDFTLVETDSETVFSGAAGATVSGEHGASAVVTGGSFVDADGNAVNGNISVKITSVDVENPAELDAFPGAFEGSQMPGTPGEPIYSLGVTNFEFTDAASGLPVQLGAGATANITIPVFNDTYQDGSVVQPGDPIALWSLDEQSATWVQEGEGIVEADMASPTGLVLRATVSHFSWWNCDVTLNAVTVTIGVEADEPGTAVVSATAIGSLGWRPNTVSTTLRVGNTTGPVFVPADREVCFTAEINFDSGGSSSTNLDCRIPAQGDVIVLAASGSILSLQLKADIPPVAAVTTVLGFPGFPIRRVELSSTTIETAVSYAIVSGSLPPGITLEPIDATTAEIVGIPPVGSGGIYPITVRGTNSPEGETNQLNLVYTISENVPVPQLPMNILAFINGNLEINTYDFNDDNTGGPASSWTLNPAVLPPGMVFDNQTGVISIPDIFFRDESFWDWDGTITATNVNGSSTSNVQIRVDCDFCGGDVAF